MILLPVVTLASALLGDLAPGQSHVASFRTYLWRQYRALYDFDTIAVRKLLLILLSEQPKVNGIEIAVVVPQTHIYRSA